ncbi:hypothetical protein C8R48DRAFT_767371 [Suillus tomentosus]|nr:hypothetical protein C8R48DRAFT_767371 [Suillus tomentosus]
MCDAMYSLLHVFAGRAAFILIDRVTSSVPEFRVVRSADIRASPSRPSFHEPAMNILVVTRHVCAHPESLAQVIHSLAYDLAVHTVCVEGLALAEVLASDARLEYSNERGVIPWLASISSLYV